MERRKRKNKSWLYIIGSLIFLCGAGLIFYDYYSEQKINMQEQEAIEEFYEEEFEQMKNDIKHNITVCIRKHKISFKKKI